MGQSDVAWDRAAAASWLQGKPRDVQVALAARSGLRSLVLLSYEGDAEFDMRVDPGFRAVLTTFVASLLPSEEISSASAAASDRASHYSGSFSRTFRSPALIGVSNGAAAVFADDSARLASMAVHSIAQTSFGTPKIDLEISRVNYRAALTDATLLDTGCSIRQLFETPAWHDEPLQVEMSQARAAVEERLSSKPHTEFWRDWYRGMTAGQERDWLMHREIALIADELWEARGADLARGIAVITGRYHLEAEVRRLKRELANLSHVSPGIGHNRSPDPIEDTSSPPALLDVNAVTIELDRQLAEPPNVPILRRLQVKIRSLIKRLRTLIKDSAYDLAKEGVKGAALVGLGLSLHQWDVIVARLTDVLNALESWMAALAAPL